MIGYHINRASEAEIAEHLTRCDADFIPPLTGRVEIEDYARKIASKATRYEAWTGDSLIGLVAIYYNTDSRITYVTNVSVMREWLGNGIATRLMSQCIAHAKTLNMKRISLQVGEENQGAIKLYEKMGFSKGQVNAPLLTMHLLLIDGE